MSQPVVYIDIVLFAGILAASVAAGALISWLLVRRRASPSPPDQGHADTRILLQLMSRADHALDNYITSIQGHLSVLGEELPTDA